MRNHEPEKRVSADEPWPARYRALQIGGAFAIIRRAISTAVPALLAQLAEQLTLNQRVEGSSPSGGISTISRQNTSESECERPRPYSTRRLAPSMQKHSILSSRPEANDRGPERPLRATQSATRSLPEDAELAAVVEAWDRLPEAIRAGIVAMVKAAS
jgi:hypothetical protein